MTDQTDPTTMTPEETTRFLAVEVMGYFPSESLKGHWIVPQGGCILFDPLTIAGDRDMLVDRMRERGAAISLGPVLWEKRYVAHTYYEKLTFCDTTFADTPGEAVCLAAVKAVLAQAGEGADHAPATKGKN